MSKFILIASILVAVISIAAPLLVYWWELKLNKQKYRTVIKKAAVPKFKLENIEVKYMDEVVQNILRVIDLRMKKGDYDSADLLLDEAIDIRPNYWFTHYKKALVNRHLAKFDSSEKHLKIALELPLSAENRVKVFIELSRLAQDAQQVQKAITYLERAIAYSENNASAYVELAGIYAQLGQYQDAYTNQRLAISIDPSSENVLLFRYYNELYLGLTSKYYSEWKQELQPKVSASRLDKNTQLFKEFVGKYRIGSVLRGRVRSFDKRFGVFVSFSNGSIGLIHTSSLPDKSANYWIDKVGKKIDVIVSVYDHKKHRIHLRLAEPDNAS